MDVEVLRGYASSGVDLVERGNGADDSQESFDTLGGQIVLLFDCRYHRPVWYVEMLM
jgi:hypothetical protein